MLNTGNFQSLNFSLFGEHIKVSGDIHFSGDTIINGDIEGNLYSQDGSHLIIERKGKIVGQLYCHSIDIYGQFDGSIHSTGSVTLHPGSSVSGIISADKLSILPGSTVNIKGSSGPASES